MKEICFFSGDITRSGGTERIGTILASELSKNKKYCVSVLSLAEINDELFFAMDAQIKREKLFDSAVSIKKNYFRIIYRLVKFINTHNIDTIIDIDNVLDMFSLPAKMFTGVKVISRECFNYYETLGKPYRMIIKRFAARYSDHIVTITTEDLKAYKENLKIKAEISQIYNPILLTDHDPYDLNAATLLSVGRLSNQKGFDLLINAAEIVFKENNGWKWIIAGEGNDRKMLEEKIREKELEGKVILAGNVPDISDCYNKAGIFVLTSRYEGFGLVLTEAKSFHLPIVSFDCKFGPSEIIKEDVNGYLIECFDIQEMAKKIKKLMQSPSKREQFSRHALEGTEQFELPAVVKEWEKVLDQIGET